MASNSRVISYASNVDTWLEPAAISAIRSELPDIAVEIVRTIQQEVPGYSRPLRGTFGKSIRSGVELTLRRFIGEGDEGTADIYRRLGFGELRAGRSLDVLQSAYRVGSRVAWLRMSEAAAATGASADAQRDLAGAMFAYIERIAGESVEGYAEAQLARAGDTQRRRAALLALLIATPPPDGQSLAVAAAAAGWSVPTKVACLLIAEGNAALTLRQLSGDTLHGSIGGLTCILVPEPSRLRHEARALVERHGLRAVLGPSVAVEQAGLSLRWSELSSELPGPGLIVAEDRLADIALSAGAEIVAALGERILAPLAGETKASRRRLEETLLAWLGHHGSQRAVAEQLGVHPQTVRYRVRRLRALFGANLEDPDRRFDMLMALRADTP